MSSGIIRIHIHTDPFLACPIHTIHPIAQHKRSLLRHCCPFAALFVKVSSKIESGDTPVSIKYATLEINVCIFPVPAPASISSYPVVIVAALSCYSFNRSKNSKPIIYHPPLFVYCINIAQRPCPIHPNISTFQHNFFLGFCSIKASSNQFLFSCGISF